MTKLEELKAVFDAAEASEDTSWAAAVAFDAAWSAYQDELEKTQDDLEAEREHERQERHGFEQV